MSLVSHFSKDQEQRYTVPVLLQAASLTPHWLATVAQHQVDPVVKMYAPTAVLQPTLSADTCDTREKREVYFKHFLSKKPVGTELVQHVRLLGDGGAGTIVVSAGSYGFNCNGTMVPARFLFVYQQQEDGGYLVLGHQSSRAPSRANVREAVTSDVLMGQPARGVILPLLDRQHGSRIGVQVEASSQEAERKLFVPPHDLVVAMGPFTNDVATTADAFRAMCAQMSRRGKASAEVTRRTVVDLGQAKLVAQDLCLHLPRSQGPDVGVGLRSMRLLMPSGKGYVCVAEKLSTQPKPTAPGRCRPSLAYNQQAAAQ